jgi:hypothetical protein
MRQNVPINRHGDYASFVKTDTSVWGTARSEDFYAFFVAVGTLDLRAERP